MQFYRAIADESATANRPVDALFMLHPAIRNRRAGLPSGPVHAPIETFGPR